MRSARARRFGFSAWTGRRSMRLLT
jgi:hypothetical protein